MKITISGTLGSGKSTVAKMLAEKLNYRLYSTGSFMRSIAEKRNISLNDLTKIAEEDPSIDKEIDNYQVELGKKEKDFVLEGRLGFYFIPGSIKLFLKCDEETAAKRILKELKKKNSSRIKEGLQEDEQSILQSLKNRRESENKRYSALYGIKQDDESKFDFIIDTTNISPEEVCEKIILFVKRKSAKKGRKR